jgi:hypothetical protein
MWFSVRLRVMNRVIRVPSIVMMAKFSRRGRPSRHHGHVLHGAFVSAVVSRDSGLDGASRRPALG